MFRIQGQGLRRGKANASQMGVEQVASQNAVLEERGAGIARCLCSVALRGRSPWRAVGLLVTLARVFKAWGVVGGAG